MTYSIAGSLSGQQLVLYSPTPQVNGDQIISLGRSLMLHGMLEKQQTSLKSKDLHIRVQNTAMY